MNSNRFLSFYSYLTLSVILTLVIPYVFSIFIPEIYKKGQFTISIVDIMPILYISILFCLCLLITTKRLFILTPNFKNIIFDKYWLIISSFFIITLWLSRILYFLLIGSSPYVSYVDREIFFFEGNNFGILILVYNYLNFNFYPFFMTLTVITLSTLNIKFCYILFFLECLFSIFIGSKAIILYGCIIFIIIFHNDFKKLILLGLLGVSVVLLKPFFYVIRFWHLGYSGGSLENVLDYFTSIVQRIQTFIPIFYYNQRVEDKLDGISLFRVFGYIVPDRILKLPYYARNEDEGIVLTNLLDKVFFGYRLDDDLFNFFGEPFSNFGIFGVFLIFFYVYLWSKLLKLTFTFPIIYFSLYSFFISNILLRPHSSFSSLTAFSIIIIIASWFFIKFKIIITK